jgi:hypothetical protein
MCSSTLAFQKHFKKASENALKLSFIFGFLIYFLGVSGMLNLKISCYQKARVHGDLQGSPKFYDTSHL